MITLYQNDVETPLVFHAKSNGKNVPLVGSEVFFDLVSKATNQRVGGGKCDILDVAQGSVKYIFKEGELAQLGEYQGRVRIDLTQGARRESLALEIQIVEIPKKDEPKQEVPAEATQ